MSNIITRDGGMDECDICCTKFNKSKHAEVICDKCGISACKLCIRQYLLCSIKDAHCMYCQNQYDIGFLVDNLNGTFVNNELEEYRKKVLFQREQAQFPDTMYLVENIRKKQKYTEICKQLQYLKYMYRKNENRLFVIDLNGQNLADVIYQEQVAQELLHKQIEEIREQRKTMKSELKDAGIIKQRKVIFIHACPSENCKGFLSTVWKCGLCDMWTCPKCFESKGLKKDDPDNPHVCNEDNIKSAELIKQETKNCPNCAVPIFKIHGCDQMYCTECHIAFSWRTGEVENGVIHNPHFFQYQQILQEKQTHERGEEIEQYAHRDLCEPCADNNMPNWYLYSGILRQSQSDNLITHEQCSWAYELYRTVDHIDQTIMRDMRHTCNELYDNSERRALYLVDEISEMVFENLLVLNEKKFKKYMACLQIYDLLITIIRECVNRIATEKTCIAVVESRQHLGKLIRYVNIELARISYLYNQSVQLPLDKGISGIEFENFKFCKDAYLCLRDYKFVHTKCSYPLRRVTTASTLTSKTGVVLICTMCNHKVDSIPFYKCCYNTYRRVCVKCLFTQHIKALNDYKTTYDVNLFEHLNQEKIHLHELFSKKKIKITQEQMDTILDYKFIDDCNTDCNTIDIRNDT